VKEIIQKEFVGIFLQLYDFKNGFGGISVSVCEGGGGEVGCEELGRSRASSKGSVM